MLPRYERCQYAADALAYVELLDALRAVLESGNPDQIRIAAVEMVLNRAEALRRAGSDVQPWHR